MLNEGVEDGTTGKEGATQPTASLICGWGNNNEQHDSAPDEPGRLDEGDEEILKRTKESCTLFDVRA